MKYIYNWPPDTLEFKWDDVIYPAKYTFIEIWNDSWFTLYVK